MKNDSYLLGYLIRMIEEFFSREEDICTDTVEESVQELEKLISWFNDSFSAFVKFLLKGD